MTDTTITALRNGQDWAEGEELRLVTRSEEPIAIVIPLAGLEEADRDAIGELAGRNDWAAVARALKTLGTAGLPPQI